jgi:hypothetical protein
MMSRPISIFGALLLVSGCVHDPWLRSECKRVRVGMPLREVYRTVGSATQYCQFRNELVRGCSTRRPDAIPLSVSWEIPVTFSTQPDQCKVDFDSAGTVTHVQYSPGTSWGD